MAAPYTLFMLNVHIFYLKMLQCYIEHTGQLFKQCKFYFKQNINIIK